MYSHTRGYYISLMIQLIDLHLMFGWCRFSSFCRKESWFQCGVKLIATKCSFFQTNGILLARLLAYCYHKCTHDAQEYVRIDFCKVKHLHLERYTLPHISLNRIFHSLSPLHLHIMFYLHPMKSHVSGNFILKKFIPIGSSETAPIACSSNLMFCLVIFFISNLSYSQLRVETNVALCRLVLFLMVTQQMLLHLTLQTRK